MQISASSARDSTDLRKVFVAIVESETSWLRASWILFMRENAQIGVEIWDIRYQKTILKVHPENTMSGQYLGTSHRRGVKLITPKEDKAGQLYKVALRAYSVSYSPVTAK